MTRRVCSTVETMVTKWGIVGLAALRLTRFVTTDTLGDWLIVQPLKRWAKGHEDSLRVARARTNWKLKDENPQMSQAMKDVLKEREESLHSDEPISWQARLVSGLECPYCVGYWIGTGAVLLELSLGNRPRLYRIWRVIAGTLGLNYVVGLVEGKVNG